MNRRTRRRGIVLALLVGVVTLLLSWGGSSARNKRGTPVLVATRSLAAGQPVTQSDSKTVPLYGSVPPGYVTNASALKGMVAAHGLVAGQPIMRGDLAKVALRQGLPAGDVGVFVPVSLASSAEVVPGDYVDVLGVGGSSGSGSGTGGGTSVVTPTALYHVKVIAVVSGNGTPVTSSGNGQTVGSYASSVPAAVEIAVPQMEAGMLVDVAATGRFWLTLDPWNATARGNQTPATFNPGAVTFPSSSGASPGSSLSGTSSGSVTGTAKPSTGGVTTVPTGTSAKAAKGTSAAVAKGTSAKVSGRKP